MLRNIFIFAFLLAISFFSCNQVTERMPDFAIHGIDVSHYQSAIDWQKVADQGVHFGFVKATEGRSMQDTMFCENWESMNDVGIIRGAYHFFRPTVSAIDQANNFIENVNIEYGDLPPVVDVEVLDNASKEMIVTRLGIWLEMVEKKYDIRPIIYTNMKFYNRYLADHFADYPIWIARYNEKLPELAKEKDWAFWQYGDHGRIDGIRGPVDLNVFQGSYYELLEMTHSPFSTPATAGF